MAKGGGCGNGQKHCEQKKNRAHVTAHSLGVPASFVSSFDGTAFVTPTHLFAAVSVPPPPPPLARVPSWLTAIIKAEPMDI